MKATSYSQDEAIRLSRNFDISILDLLRGATMTPKQRGWVLDVYTRLSGSRDQLLSVELSALLHRNPASLKTYQETSQAAMKLIEDADTAYQRVFVFGQEFEPAYQYCDGEITFACSEAMARLRAVVLFHTYPKAA